MSLGASQARAQLLFEDQGESKLEQFCGDGCWTNHGRIVDLNGDGKLDLVFANSAGFFTKNPAAEPLVVYLNDGAANFTAASQMLIGGFVGRVRQVAFADIEGDGDIDMFAPDADGLADALFVNQNNMSFVNEAATRIGGLKSTAGATRFGDIDSDGDMDLLIANGYAGPEADNVKLYLNDGMGNFAEKPGAFPPFGGSGKDPDDLDLADFDGDFDLDLLVNPHNQGSAFIVYNDGSGTFSNALLLPGQSGNHYNPGVGDLDGDGDRDIVIDNIGGGLKELLLINSGNGSFENKSMQISPNGPQDDNGAAFIDYDHDGDLDLVVPSLASPDERLYANDGMANFAIVPGAFSEENDATLWIDFGDLNGDGRLDAATAQGESGPNFNERVYLGTTNLKVDTSPPRISALDVTALPSGEARVRFAVTDAAITDDGPRLRRAWVFAGGATVPARFMGGDLFLAVVPAANASDPLTACAEDLQGNMPMGCSEPNPTTTSASSAAVAAVSSSAAGSSGAGASTSGSGGAAGDGGDDMRGGCSCRVQTKSDATWLPLAGFMCALAIVRYGRRQTHERSSQ